MQHRLEGKKRSTGERGERHGEGKEHKAPILEAFGIVVTNVPLFLSIRSFDTTIMHDTFERLLAVRGADDLSNKPGKTDVETLCLATLVLSVIVEGNRFGSTLETRLFSMGFEIPDAPNKPESHALPNFIQPHQVHTLFR